VHVLYEVAGTSAAFASSAAITRFGNNYSYFMSPIFFALAGVCWYFITPRQGQPGARAVSAAEVGLSEVEREHKKLGAGGYVKEIGIGAWHFVK
jgi:hypothetical protein